MKTMWFLVEGPTDELFIEKIIKPLFGEKSSLINFWYYIGKKKKKIAGLLRSCRSANWEYLLLRDLDNASKCIIDRKNEYLNINALKLDENDIVIVKLEIESWFYAGISNLGILKLNIPKPRITDQTTKEDLLRIMPRSYISKILFYNDLTKYFDIGLAKKRNASFRYFMEKTLPRYLNS